MRVPGWQRHPFLLASGLGLGVLLGFSLALGFGPGDLRALLRHLRFRRSPDAVSLRLPEAQSRLVDFLPEEEGLAIQDAALCRINAGTVTPLTSNQGLIRCFPGEGQLFLSASYHRLLSRPPGGALRLELVLPGVVREVKQRGQLLAVAFEDDTAAPLGHIRLFRRMGEFWDPTGVEVPIGLDRWCGFDLSPDGRHLLANLPGGRGVALWSVAEGREVARWETQRLARILHVLPDGAVCFDRGPALKGSSGRLADARNEVVQASPGASAPIVLFQGFAQVLASAAWPDRSRLAFSDAEGMLRVLSFSPGIPPQECAPRDRGVPLRLRPHKGSLWVLFKGEQVRVERFDLR